MISATNITDTRIPYQVQTFTANDLPPPASSINPTSESGSGAYKVSLNTQINRLGQEHNTRKEDLKQQHETEVRQLDREYNRQQQKIEQEYRSKKNDLKINLYA